MAKVRGAGSDSDCVLTGRLRDWEAEHNLGQGQDEKVEVARAKGRPKQQHNPSQGQAKEMHEGEGNTGRSALHFIAHLGVVQVFLQYSHSQVINKHTS